MITSWNNQRKRQHNNKQWQEREVKQRLVEFSCDRADVSEGADIDNVGEKGINCVWFYRFQLREMIIDKKLCRTFLENADFQIWLLEIWVHGRFDIVKPLIYFGKLFESQDLHRRSIDIVQTLSHFTTDMFHRRSKAKLLLDSFRFHMISNFGSKIQS